MHLKKCVKTKTHNSTFSECSFKSIEEHKSHKTTETAVRRGEVGGMGDSMGGDGLEVAVSLKISRTFHGHTESFFVLQKIHEPQGISLLCKNPQGSRGHSEVEESNSTCTVWCHPKHPTLHDSTLSLHGPLCSSQHSCPHSSHFILVILSLFRSLCPTTSGGLLSH